MFVAKYRQNDKPVLPLAYHWEGLDTEEKGGRKEGQDDLISMYDAPYWLRVCYSKTKGESKFFGRFSRCVFSLGEGTRSCN